MGNSDRKDKAIRKLLNEVDCPRTAELKATKDTLRTLIVPPLRMTGTARMDSTPPVDLTRLVRPSWFKGDADCGWHEDAGHENGSYYCKCLDCDADFVGHKRRHICRKCHYEAKARYDALTPEERAAFDEKRNAEIRAYFSQKNA